MKIKIFHLIIITTFINIGCSGKENKEATKTTTKVKTKIIEKVVKKELVKDSIFKLIDLKLKTDASKSYEFVKESIKVTKVALSKKEVSIDSVALIFKQSLVNRIIPFWAGTPWTFEGHTSVPNKGEIACGYFVSTTLKHMGVNLNRYKLAQQSPINEAKSLALDSNVIKVNESSMKETTLKIKEKIRDGIHFIGLGESHVGFILKEKGELYLIHSNFAGNNGVEVELFEYSDVVTPYTWYYIVELSSNETFLKNWIKGKQIKIITS